MKLLAIAFILFGIVPASYATELPRASEIIEIEGQFVFTDGSSFFIFKKDHSFSSGPLELSGREITGTWELRDDRLFVIRGKWTWINGLSARDDYREMQIAVYRPQSVETVKSLSYVAVLENVKVYKCYFVVEELSKVSKASN